ncbi:MAG: deoxyguanosinetriphosphate triphosphohydrolase [Clostridiales Family XIII bacterium]|jgi:dGTPase|nr:deoxyguanosinetriphosphate triphosphohydrolase [Clostridiales Family XIII bacterium]
MLKREESERREYEILSGFAAKAAESAGRAVSEEKCEFRTDFQRDRDRVIHSKALRRLMHKTQVFLSPEGDHYRTRLTHTLEVAQISRSIARGLRLNEDLTEAIAMAHDLGHTPFGHNGEFYLDKKHPGGFSHNVQSLRVVDVLESSGGRRGMNLTDEVRDGIVNHTGPRAPRTLEGQVVKISDRIAYINHDIDDALRSGVITEDDLPKSAVRILGNKTKIRIDTLVRDMIMTSDGRDVVSLSPDCAGSMDELRTYMFANVYQSEKVKRSEELEKIKFLISSLYDYYLENPDDLPAEYVAMIGEFGKEEMVKDQVAGMTDRYAIDTFERLFVPTGWKRD